MKGMSHTLWGEHGPQQLGFARKDFGSMKKSFSGDKTVKTGLDKHEPDLQVGMFTFCGESRFPGNAPQASHIHTIKNTVRFRLTSIEEDLVKKSAENK